MIAFLHHILSKSLPAMLRIVVICGALTAPWSAVAQGWQRYYQGERFFALQVLPDGSLVAAGSIRNAGEQSDVYWLHTDPWGAVIDETSWGDTASVENAQALLPMTGGGWLLPGNSNSDSIFGATVNAQGSFTGMPLLTSGLLYSAANATQNGWLFCGAQKDTNAVGNNITRALCGRVNASGQLVWERADSLGLNSVGVDMAIAGTGDAWVTGRLINALPTVNTDAFLLKIDTNGNLLQSNIIALTDDESPEKITLLPNGHLRIVGEVKNPANTNLQEEDIWMMETDASGLLLWTKSIPIPGFQQVHSFKVLTNGDLILAGETRPTLTGSRDAFLARTDAAGNLIWFKTYGGIKGDIFWEVEVHPDGGFAIAGQSASFGDGTLHAWLVRTDDAGNLWSGHVEGKVVHDQTQDCTASSGEAPLSNWLMAAAGNAGIFYTTTDESGHYDFTLDTGAWYISILPPVGYWLPCEDSVLVNLVQTGDTAHIQFPVQAAYNCPLLQVDITTPYLRRCFDNQYTVRWFNYGPVDAAQTHVAVIPDPYLSVTGSSLPFTASGDTLWFDVGITTSLQGGSFTINALLDCNQTMLGQTHCTTAWITPDSVCYAINPEWDGASLDVNGYCAGDSVVLTITNVGLGGMQQPVEYVIIEDQVIFKRAPLLLAASADTTFVLYPNGHTVTLLLTQTPGYPGNSHPMLMIEGCGSFSFPTGQALQFPNDDGDPFTDTECRENIGSFDPNDKIGLPHGVGNEHVIRAGDAVEYVIRFQNTGTDTAFYVAIRDTLPVGLAIASLETGASSHPYRLEIKDQGVLQFVFPSIALPDSATDWAASRGFVKYRITTKANLPDGTIIRNRAGIYFDFNAPVITPFTLHTIGDPLGLFTVLETNTPESFGEMEKLSVTPNPFNETTVLAWPSTGNNATYEIQITGTDGRLRASYATTENTLQLSNSKLPPGIFFLRIFSDTSVIATGKIIKTQ